MVILRLESEIKPTGTTRKIRILLVDDHHVVREGLRAVLALDSDLEIVGEAENGNAALKLARKFQPDVVVMDINMPEMNGIEATRRIREELPDIKVVGLSMHDESHMSQAMNDAGAAAFLTKGVHSETLISAIHSCGRCSA